MAKLNRATLFAQAGALKSYFPEGIIKRKGERELVWTGLVKPSPLSAVYTLKLHCIHGKVSVYVIKPKPLCLAEGKSTLPHVYNHTEQKLCLFYPKDKEWNSSMLYVRTLIPWACEWLLHYECWVATGFWHGGGINHDTDEEKKGGRK